MNREQIIQMAREADLVAWLPNSSFSDGVWWIEAHEVGSELEAFAKLVAEHERSECADMVFKYISQTVNMEARGCLASVAYDIRARGNL